MTESAQTSTANPSRLVLAMPTPTLLYLGRIAAGIPVEAIEDQQREDLLSLLTRPGRYALRVCDDSLIEGGIYNGDILVIQSQQQVNSGDLALLLIDQEAVSVSRIRYRTAGRIELLSDSPEIDCRSLRRSRVVVQGKVIAQLRRYR